MRTLCTWSLVVFAAVPLVVVAPAPLQDWPSHLARTWITDHLTRGDDGWSTYYTFQGFLIPNAALDVLAYGLLKTGLGLALAGRVILLLDYALFVAGFWRLARTLGSADDLTPLFGAVLFYNFGLVWGLVNYTFGVGLFLVVFGAWIGSTDREAQRWALTIFGTTAVALCHVIPAALLTGVLGSCDLYDLTRRTSRAGLLRSRVTCSSLGALIALGLILRVTHQSGDTLYPIRYGGDGTVWGFLLWKVGIYAKALLTGAAAADIALVVLGGLFASVVLAFAKLRLSMRLALATAGLMAVTAAAPDIVGNGAYLDIRIPIVTMATALASVRWEWRRPVALRWAWAVLAGLVMTRSLALAASWEQDGSSYAALRRTFADLPKNSVVLAVRGRNMAAIGWREWWDIPVATIGAIAVEYGAFVPSVYAGATQQPLVLRAAWTEWGYVRNISEPGRGPEAVTLARGICEEGLAVFFFVTFPGEILPGTTAIELPPRLDPHRFELRRLC